MKKGFLNLLNLLIHGLLQFLLSRCIFMSLLMLLRDCRTLITAMQVYLNLKLLWLFKSSVQLVVCFVFHLFSCQLVHHLDVRISLGLGNKSRVGLGLSEYQIKH